MLSDYIIANIFALLILFAVIMFLIFDGADLGVASVMPFLRTQDNKKIAISSIHPFWDVNETWIILAAVFLITGFTSVYGIFIRIFYIPVILLLGLIILRGVAIEFATKNDLHFSFWSWIFTISSTLISLVLGVFVGNLVNGFRIDSDGIILTSFFDLFNPVSLISGACVVLGLSLLGCSFLALKTEFGELLKVIVKRIAFLLVFFGLILLCLILFYTKITPSRLVLTCLLCTMSILFTVLGANKYYYMKFNASMFYFIGMIIVTSLALLSITYPYIVPYKLSIFDILRFNSNTANYIQIFSLIFLFLGLVLFYFFKNYRVFNGFVKSSNY